MARRRHSCEVTADRLAAHFEVYCNCLSQQERDILSEARAILIGLATDPGVD